MSSFKRVLCISLILGALAVALCVPFVSAKVFTENGITWNTELSKGLAQAKSENKFVLADVYTDWCGYCKKLDKVTFADPSFAAFVNQQFVCVKVNAEDNGEGTHVMQENHVSAFPCGLVYDSSGKVVGRIVGYMAPKDYEKNLAKIIKGGN